MQAYRWVMTGAGKPMEKVAFEAVPGHDTEVVVEIAGCGVCHTDLGYFYDGVRLNHPLPLALGHEISGRVVSAGSQFKDLLGRAVIVPAVFHCGECERCRKGKSTICTNQKMPGNDIQGGFASHIVVPGRGLCLVDELRLNAAGMELADLSVVADAVTTPYQAVMQADIEPGSLTIVIGVGGVGSYCVQLAHAFGATVIAVDIDKDKLDAVVSHGAAMAIDAKQHDARSLKKAIAAFAKDHGLPSGEWNIFECSGTRAGQETAFNLLVQGATVGIVGFTMDKVEVRLSNLMAYHARALGNWGCPVERYPDVLELVLEGKVKVKPFVEHHAMNDINKIFEAVHRHELKKRAILIP